jgi:hypothetical protein
MGRGMTLTRTERFSLLVLLVIFTWFTWRGMTAFFSGDDVMNLHAAWILNPWRLAKAQLFFWMPIYRPLGGGIYRVFYALFGFHPEPLYVFCWAFLVVNVVLAYRFFRELSGSVAEALTALALTLVHGNFQDLYISAGTIYDRLWFLFTVLGLTVYARMRRQGQFSVRRQALICLLCILSMGSKESGVALPALLFCFEVIYYFAAHREGGPREWRKFVPLYGVLGAISLLFVFLRVNRTPELVMTAAYKPHPSFSIWLTRVAEYFTILTYGHVKFTVAMCALTLAAMAAAAVLLRNKAMLFGLAFFIITITPVALISSRPGYVLYVPDLGLGLFFAAVIAGLARRIPRGEMVAFAVVTLAMTWFHQRNWPVFFDTKYSPERRLSEQFRSEYPEMPRGTKFLFVSDEFPNPAYDLLFNLRLLYNDHSILVNRLQAPVDQQPNPQRPIRYDHVFSLEGGRYVELDTRDPAESIRLHILRDYAVGMEMDALRRDFPAYVVSGVGDGNVGNPIRWTKPKATLKFRLYPAAAILTVRCWVPDFVAKTAVRTLSVQVGGKEIGVYPLQQDGMNEFSFPVPAELITRNGFTLVDLVVTNPWKDTNGQELGVVLMRAEFRYRE